MLGIKLLVVKFFWVFVVKFVKIICVLFVCDIKIVVFGVVLLEIVFCFGLIVILLKESVVFCFEFGILIWIGVLFCWLMVVINWVVVFVLGLIIVKLLLVFV